MEHLLLIANPLHLQEIKSSILKSWRIESSWNMLIKNSQTGTCSLACHSRILNSQPTPFRHFFLSAELWSGSSWDEVTAFDFSLLLFRVSFCQWFSKSSLFIFLWKPVFRWWLFQELAHGRHGSLRTRKWLLGYITGSPSSSREKRSLVMAKI